MIRCAASYDVAIFLGTQGKTLGKQNRQLVVIQADEAVTWYVSTWRD